LGEAVVSETEAQQYLAADQQLITDLAKQYHNVSPQISVKLLAQFLQAIPWPKKKSSAQC